MEAAAKDLPVSKASMTSLINKEEVKVADSATSSMSLRRCSVATKAAVEDKKLRLRVKTS